ncbi:MAG: hypothetical protein KAT15_19750, partial [Bacteroidales bacterium]|nr:hypothetical protein [Bacteroidales bacterium]
EYMQWEFHKWGVDVVLSAHDHIYARLENPEEEGTHYIINGLGGKSRYRCNDNILAPGISVLACFDDNFGAMRCMVTPNRLEMAFYSIGDPGNPVDQLVILK